MPRIYRSGTGFVIYHGNTDPESIVKIINNYQLKIKDKDNLQSYHFRARGAWRPELINYENDNFDER